MTGIAFEQEAVELTPEKLDDYVAAAASVVEELGTFLGSHYEELIKCHMLIHGKRIAMDMPAAHQDPKYVAHIHTLKNACDSFCNVMRGNF